MTNTLATGLGTLYIVATPIGNREDISFRALNTLKSVDLILAEDTRHSMQLLTSLGIKNNLTSLHAHNEANKSNEIIELLLHGKSIALISDAGTPLISDPGFPLVKQARQHHIPVVPVPGACALIAALSAAGVPCDSFAFLGFLPAKQSARKHALESSQSLPYTIVFYESTHRIIDCLNDIAEIYGQDYELVLAKEITKTFERFVSGKIKEIKDWLLSEPGHIKGEFVLIFPPRSTNKDLNSHEELLKILLEELPLKQAVAIACRLTNANKNQLYEEALKLKES
ncbi:TPA: 16S rRNA (cytidine(1402)-2'-O)-methyltransferase [Legionella pneumophila]|uniref:Ribosomal RNA small subunit methyltransferase I n=1 Tax=Legionella pneumophila subsp. pneumophila TaxID=91891 RepID=A0A3A6UHJ9_LEGPN|nr:16S rRNA (cytidine(1402)-2'-O)-methyltransferase [Legionella pneumophila]ERH45522.1 16S rRNA methyltransferase [Legionella pneumophila str. Leg01/11]ERI48728.1 16S rRNA methyltransferase [Legionella pneumophila str. Leg01/20]AGH52101.1 rRNA small subunit methyltransferase I [Legionella pneumophila subsp. pneumophila LPE509]ANN97020.1 16S rRNA (cytidine(1402)-2'-O)-methyltransferase [Legionella pneumophila]MCK0182943.1 16S rRNA (cytidine(1402)-2'-O)-methyltransferase [Legionella pneumophila]